MCFDQMVGMGREKAGEIEVPIVEKGDRSRKAIIFHVISYGKKNRSRNAAVVH